MNSKTRAISEGAMLLAVMAVLLIIDRQFANFFELMLCLLSVPVAVYEVRHGTKMTIAFAIASFVISFLFSTITGMFYSIIAVIIGVVYGYGVLNDWQNHSLLFFSVLANIVSTYITVVMFAGVFGYNIQEEVNLMLKTINDMGLSHMNMTQLVLEVIILSYMAMAFLQAVMTHLLTNLMLQRCKLKYRPLNTIFDVHISKMTGIFIVLATVLYYFTMNMNIDQWLLDGIMFLYLVAFIIAIVNGCITTMCFLRIKGRGRMAIMFSMFACLVPGLNHLIATLGVMDIFFSLRERMKAGVLNEISRKN